MKDNQADLNEQLKEVVALLNKIDRTYASERSKTIALLQNKIWDEPTLQHEELYFLAPVRSYLTINRFAAQRL